MLVCNPHYNHWEFSRVGLLCPEEEGVSCFSRSSVPKQGTAAASEWKALVEPGCVRKKGEGEVPRRTRRWKGAIGTQRSLRACDSFC